MDPFSLTVGTVGLIGAVNACLKLAKKFVGPSKFGKAELAAANSTLYEALGILNSFKAFLDLHEDDESHMQTLVHLEPAMDRCQEALKTIRVFMQGTSTVEKIWKGARFDKEFKNALNAVDSSSKLFKLAVMADQQELMLGVGKYLQVIGKDVEAIREGQQETQNGSSYAMIKAWLGAQADNDMNSQRHQDHSRLRYPESCKWLNSHVDFTNWMNNPPSDKMAGIWLKGSPGAGKSHMCSMAIDTVAKTQDLYLYYFYSFDYQFHTSTAPGNTADESKLRLSSLLIDQLLRLLWKEDPSVTNRIWQFIEIEEKNTKTLAQVVQILLKNTTQEEITAPEKDKSPPRSRRKIYLLLDGLNETQGPFTGKDLLDVAMNLFSSVEEEVCLRLWVSSQDNMGISKSLSDCTVINLDDQAESDVREHLAREVPKTIDINFGDVDHQVHGKQLAPWVLDTLQRRAKGNFLYAKLAIDQLSGTISPDDLISFLESEIPEPFTDMYERIFFRYQKAQHKYVSLLFSLVTFARRPLRLSELQDLMTLALSDPSKEPNPLRRPTRLHLLFPPLIETQHDPDEPENPFCRLRHSTVHSFLISNPHVLCSERGTCDGACQHLISSQTFGYLCLRYLSQPKYNKLLSVKPDLLADADPLLLYFADFWTKHLEDLEPTNSHRDLVAAFASSSNFRTLLQVQSLFVDGQFEQLPIGVGGDGVDKLVEIMQREGYHHLHRQSFPSWFFRDKNNRRVEEYVSYRGQYRHFVNEWGYLLTRATFPSDQDYFPGEIERCLSGMMGPSSFLADKNDKYPSFMLSQDPFDCLGSNPRVMTERLSTTGDRFMVVSTIPREYGCFLAPFESDSGLSTLSFRIETWDLRENAVPNLTSTSNISAASLNESFGEEASAVVTRKEGLKEAYIWLDDLPVPNQGKSNPMLLHEKQCQHDLENISFDFRTRGSIIVSTRRSKYQSATAPLETSQHRPEDLETVVDDSRDLSSADSSEVSSSEDDEDDAAEETCSEGSTEFDSAEESSDDGTDERDGSSSGDDHVSSAAGAEDEDSSDDSYDSSSSYDDDGYPKNGRGGSRQQRKALSTGGIVESNLAFGNEEEMATRTRARPMPRLSERSNMINASLNVYDIRSGHPVRLFHFRQDLPVMLYSSPPALHPSKSLVAWPLGGGDVLFADYMSNTYFIRGAVPNTQDSRHMTMQSHFSKCGRYLHISSIEARIVEKGKHKSDRYGEEPGSNSLLASKSAQSATVWATDPRLRSQELVLSAFVTTHRLSGAKTTRSPPRLIHRAIVGLGRYAALSLDNLPITFNWAPEYVYLSLSGHRLNVIRVRLFRSEAAPKGPAEPIACAPRLPVMLPLSATGRQVHYLPPPSSAGETTDCAGADRRGIVLMGSYGGYGDRVQLRPSVEVPHRDHCGVDAGHTMPYPCPPVGFYVDEERDFGGWVPYEAEGTGAPAPGEKFRDGRLVMRKMEGFSAQDDIDLEGICFICKGPIYISTGPSS